MNTVMLPLTKSINKIEADAINCIKMPIHPLDQILQRNKA